MAANGIMFMDPPPGFWSAAMVPYEPNLQQLSQDAAIAHLSNNKCGKRAHDQVRATAVLVLVLKRLIQLF